MATWSFKFASAFDPDDALSLWACTLAVAFNDVVYANVKVGRATNEWERFYEWRVATGHFNEACRHLERARGVAEVEAFLDGEPEVRGLHEAVLDHYAALRALTNRLRNEAAFHYPYKSGQRAIARALRELAEETGTMGAPASTKIKDMRLDFADEVVARMVFNAAGGSEEAYTEAATGLAEGVAAFGRFANHALDAYFVVRGVERVEAE